MHLQHLASLTVNGSRRKAPRSRWTSVLATMGIFIALLPSFVGGSRAAASYSCGNGAFFHCYAINVWKGNQYGAADTQYVSQQQCNCDINIGITNETWVIQNGCGTSNCWVEAGVDKGVLNFGQQYNEQFFWADTRPDGSYNSHHIADVGPDLNTYVNWDIDKCGSNFCGKLTDYSGALWTFTSSPNGMNPNEIDIGLELAGSYGASQSPASFYNNQWHSTNGNWLYYQTVDGSMQVVQSTGSGSTVTISPPPYIKYVVRPSQSSTGGQIQTWYC